MTISATTQGIKPGVCTSTNRPAAPFDGQVIYMTDVDQTAVWDGTQWTVLAPIAGGRNVIINGNMAVWQRGTTSTSTTDGFLVADRWYIYKSGGNTTVSQQTASLDGFTYSLRFQRVAGATATGTRALAHMFENTTTARLVNKTITLSFWAKCGANFSGTSSLLGWTLITGTGSTDVNFLTTGYTGQATTGSGSVTLTTSWQRFSASISVPSGKTQMGFYLSYAPTGTAGANDWFEVTGVQLEAGAVATPFEFEDYGTTMQKCQRYYQERNNFFRSQAIGGQYQASPLSTTVPMRTAPTVTLKTASGRSATYVGALIPTTTVNGARLDNYATSAGVDYYCDDLYQLVSEL